MTKQEPSAEPKSACCGAPVIVSTSDEGTSFYICSGCQRACDRQSPAKNDELRLTHESVGPYTVVTDNTAVIDNLQSRIKELEADTRVQTAMRYADERDKYKRVLEFLLYQSGHKDGNIGEAEMKLIETTLSDAAD